MVPAPHLLPFPSPVDCPSPAACSFTCCLPPRHPRLSLCAPVDCPLTCYLRTYVGFGYLSPAAFPLSYWLPLTLLAVLFFVSSSLPDIHVLSTCYPPLTFCLVFHRLPSGVPAISLPFPCCCLSQRPCFPWPAACTCTLTCWLLSHVKLYFVHVSYGISPKHVPAQWAESRERIPTVLFELQREGTESQAQKRECSMIESNHVYCMLMFVISWRYAAIFYHILLHYIQCMRMIYYFIFLYSYSIRYTHYIYYYIGISYPDITVSYIYYITESDKLKELIQFSFSTWWQMSCCCIKNISLIW